MSRTSLVLLRVLMSALVLFAAMQIGPDTARADERHGLAGFEGDWRQVDPAVNNASRHSAIDRAIGRLSWVVRKMAAPVLRRSTAPPTRMQFIWDGERLVQRIMEPEGRNAARVVDPEAGPVAGTDKKGDPTTASWHLTDSVLQLDWTQAQAHGHNIYRVDPETKILIIEHMIQVTAISNVEPIIFVSQFDRSDLPDLPSVFSAEIDSVESTMAQ